MEFYIPFFVKSLIASISAVSIHMYINYFKNKTIITNNQLAVAVLFSPSVYIITLSISDNLALSLGMIGALSIVRFRNPVKDPLEIIIYFLFITIGITLAVNHYYYLILILLTLCFPIFSLVFGIINNKLFNKYSKRSDELENYNCSIVIESDNLIEKLPKNILGNITSMEEEVQNGKNIYKINLSLNDISKNENIKKEFNKCGNLISFSLFRFF